MTLRQKIADLKRPLEEVQKERAQQEEMVLPGEYSIHGPEGPAILLREDGSIQIGREGAYLIIDPTTGTISIVGRIIATHAGDIVNEVGSGSFYINGAELVKAFYAYYDDASVHEYEVSPTVQTHPASLQETVLTGAPSVGQVPVPLSKYLKAKPIFRKTSRSNEVRNIMRHILHG